MLFEVTFSDGSVRTLQAHNRKQLEMALDNVKLIKPALKATSTESVKTVSDRCNCTPQHARCAIGIELEGKSMEAHVAIEQAVPEHRIALYSAFNDAVAAYQKHVKQSHEEQAIGDYASVLEICGVEMEEEA